jgi:hypothetical protein
MNRPLAWLIAASSWAAIPLRAAPPDWAVSGRSPGHPAPLYVVGSGSSTESVDLARQAAMADVVRQVRARVRSTSEDEHWEASSTTAGRERGESSWTGAKVKASEEVAGIQVVETARDGKTWYALAVLDRSAFAAPGRAGMREADADARQRWSTATEASAGKRPMEALQDLRQIEVDRSRFQSARERAALGEPDALDESFPIARTRSDSLRREVARGFHFRRAKDSIEAGADRIWPDSAGLSVEFLGSPVAGLEVDLVDPSGRILGTAKTDSTGFAAPTPARMPTTNQAGWSRWTLRPRLDLRPSAEIDLAVRIAGSTVRIRLDWTDSIDSGSIESVEDRLNSAGWTIDRREGTPVAARLQISHKGETQGFSGSLHRVEARLVLSRKSARVECAGVGTGRSVELASKNALERMSIPPEAMRELLGER